MSVSRGRYRMQQGGRRVSKSGASNREREREGGSAIMIASSRISIHLSIYPSIHPSIHPSVRVGSIQAPFFLLLFLRKGEEYIKNGCGLSSLTSSCSEYIPIASSPRTFESPIGSVALSLPPFPLRVYHLQIEHPDCPRVLGLVIQGSPMQP